MAVSPLNFYYCGYQRCSPRHYFGPAIRAHYILHYVVSGKGIFRVGKNIYHVKKNQAFLICPKDLTYYEADAADPWEYIWFGFDGEEGDRLLDQCGFNKENCICFPEDEEKIANFLLQSLPCFKNPLNTHTELAGWFYLLFSCLKSVNSEQKSQKSHVQAAIEYMRINFAENINVEEVSDMFHIDRTHLYKLCKKYTNLSPKEFLTQKRLAKAKDLLIYSIKSITEIALASGFHDSSSFSKTFKQYVQMSPSEYRKAVSVSKVTGFDINNSETYVNSKVMDSFVKKNIPS